MSEIVLTMPANRYRLKHVARAEVAKLLTLRSTAVTAGVTLVGTLLVTALVTNSALHHNPEWYFGFDPTQETLTGLIVAALTSGVLGAMLITGEYSSGTIRTTLSATPKRPLLLGAKVGVTAAAMVLFCEILSFASFFLGQAILSAGGAPSASLATAGALRAVALTGLFVSLLALMSFGFGLICRSTAGAIASFVGVVFVLPLVMRAISEPDLRYVPTMILTNSIMSTVPQGQGQGPIEHLAPGVGLLLMACYAAVSLIAGAVMFVKRDA
jgi:ABC-2 type transport system permease protein